MLTNQPAAYQYRGHCSDRRHRPANLAAAKANTRALLQDIAGCLLVHGLPDRHIFWSLRRNTWRAYKHRDFNNTGHNKNSKLGAACIHTTKGRAKQGYM